MTPSETLLKLEKEADEKHLLYLTAGQELVKQDGIIPKAALDNFEKAKEEWQKASADYRSFLSQFAKEKKVS
ncbi:hypothetical protein [Arcticibacter sp. MXS-1]|uniref:hypothetical protein n=1 Tax=Arcticibacter sp. MXS-1 TaxID=3341726 RepID=UPI0035A938F2